MHMHIARRPVRRPPCSQVHHERLLGLLYRLTLAADATSSAESFAHTSTHRPPQLVAWHAGREQAATALLSVGAVPHAIALAERVHDYKTLARLCTQPPPPLPAALLRGRRVPPAHDLRHELIGRLAASPPPPLYAHEAAAERGFVHELCLAHYELGWAACRDLLHLPEAYPFLVRDSPHYENLPASDSRANATMWLSVPGPNIFRGFGCE